MLLTALRANHGRRLGKELADLAQLARDPQRIDPGAGLIRLDETIHELIEAREGFFHGRG
jgi:hypothetical protein